MLRELRIRSLGVIDDVAVELGPGLNVVTGETGAGKTLVVHSLGLLFGARADAGLVRSGAAQASVEGVIEGDTDHPAFARAREAGGDVEDELLLARTVTAAGRSRAVAGGRTVPAGVLAELAEDLVVVHGQADQWRLRSAEEQRALLDAFGGPGLAAALASYQQAYAGWRAAEQECARLVDLTQARNADLHALRAGVERIEAVDPQPGEDAALRAEDERLGHAEGLRTAALAASAALVGDDGAGAADAVGLLAAARGLLGPQLGHDPQLAMLAARLDDLAALASDLGADLSGYASGIDLDGDRLAEVQNRRARLREVTRDFGGDVEATLAWLAEASGRLHAIDTAADDLAAARAEEDQARTLAAAAAAALSAEREAAASVLGEAVTSELAHLAMGAALVTVDVSARADTGGLLRPGDSDPVRVTRNGADEIEFRFRSGPGLPERPIVKSASGGELSRVMLAIEVALGERIATIPTYVFDEVDAGVGGAAALDVGARLARLARSAQVIVVTHLPQVAAFADRHLVVMKDTDGPVTASGIRTLTDGDDREGELGRMMAGTDSPTARSHAAELRARATSITRDR
ncbi:DNA repair protein RecN [Nostocoides jenkinsii]|uniref:DNA repair protein RecN n=1 Tax=Nostocoides jenkinsii Ben 74 TaxID=1193518 RepID=A0A077MAR8_9MICO|nr:DNA repair protein RecN [Tetrasphaera jenkinsii]CCI51808.1 DNA repair protein recN [Tetrasphaera jenkinsii Ben 74]